LAGSVLYAYMHAGINFFIEIFTTIFRIS